MDAQKRKTSQNLQQHNCVICERYFENASRLLKHLMSHVQEKPHDCTTCGKGFGIECSLKIHMIVHKRRGFQCNQCPATFRRNCGLEKHTRVVHQKVKAYPCKICGTSFGDSWTRANHIRSHLNEKPYQCSVCDKRFSSKHGRDLHLRVHDENRQKYCCLKCPQVFLNEINLQRHTSRKHTRPEKQALLCIFCDSGFRFRPQLEMHLRTAHLNENTYPCSVCGEEYGSFQRRLNHFISAHSELAKKHPCKMCGKEFIRPSSLSTHVRFVHIKKETFECSICSKTFSNSPNLSRHFKIHAMA